MMSRNIFVPNLDLDFRKGFLPAVGLTFTRASANGTYINSTGLLATAAIDAPRFDFDPATLLLKGVLIEAARSNLALWSRDLTNAAWVKSNTTAAKTATGVDGAANEASTLTATAGNGTALQSLTNTSAQRITSAWVKRRTGTGVVEMTQDNGTTWTPVTVTAAWTRVAIPATTSANPIFGFRIVTSGDAIDVDYVQHERGEAPSSAILTTTASATRSTEICSMPVTAIPGFNPAEGTIAAEAVASLAAVPVSSEIMINIDDGSATNRIELSRASSTLSTATVVVASAAVLNVGGAMALPANTLIRGAMCYRVNDAAGSFNDAAPSKDVVGAIPLGLTTLRIGTRAANAAPFNGHIRRIRYWNRRLADQQSRLLASGLL